MVEVRDLKKSFGDKPVLRGISIGAAQGELLAVMGSSGGGKTTLLRCMCGLLKPDSGNVIVNGVDVQANPVLAREQMGLVFQSAALFDYMTVWENVLFGLRRKSKQSHAVQDQKAKDALELVGLLDSLELMPSELSGGMRKRLGLARALVLEPRVMLYDEPTTGLDPITTYTIDSLIVDVRKRLEMTSIVVSHDLSSVFRIADRIAFLDAGELVFVGTPASFKESKHPAILELLEKAFASTLG